MRHKQDGRVPVRPAEVEAILRNAGFSRADAKSLVSYGYRALRAPVTRLNFWRRLARRLLRFFTRLAHAVGRSIARQAATPAAFVGGMPIGKQAARSEREQDNDVQSA